jgi:pyridoxal phosphate enzyme (YggS family)
MATASEASSIAANLDDVQRRITTAAQSAGRAGDSVKLIVVSKGRSEDQIRAAYQAGQRAFGENRVEEALPKTEALADLEGLEWHMVGHIQSRKTSEVAVWADWVHSVDRLKIARRLNDQYDGDLPLPIFLECNVSGEVSKYGWNMAEEAHWPELVGDLETVLSYTRMQVVGLMTMAPWTSEQTIIRSTFRRLRLLRDHLQEKVGRELPYLSMGMTADFEVAIQEGATHVRIGTAVFEGDQP